MTPTLDELTRDTGPGPSSADAIAWAGRNRPELVASLHAALAALATELRLIFGAFELALGADYPPKEPGDGS